MPDPNVVEYRLSQLETNQKELMQEVRRIDRLLSKLEGKSEASHLATQVSEIRRDVWQINRDLGEVVGAMAKADDQGLSKAAQDITIFAGDTQGDAVVGRQEKTEDKDNS